MTRAYLTAALVLAGIAWHQPAAGELKTVEQVAADAVQDVEFVGDGYLEQRRRANPDLLLVDVRTEAEFEAGHIPGAVWMERGVAEFRLAGTVRDPDAEIILYCRSGPRAALVLKSLQDIGYRNVRAHQGYDGWAARQQ